MKLGAQPFSSTSFLGLWETCSRKTSEQIHKNRQTNELGLVVHACNLNSQKKGTS